MTKPDMTFRIGLLEMKNPVTVASGTFGYGTEFADFYPPEKLGGLFLKGLTLKEREGNPPQRLVETPSGLLNAIGLQNVGYRRFLKEKLPPLMQVDTAVIANVCGSTIEDYVGLAGKLSKVKRVDAIELNISCPNVRKGGMAFGCVPQSTEEITRAVKEVYPKKPLIVKLSPNVTDISATARAAEAGGANALSVVNTFVGMAIDVKSRRPKLGNLTGGLSGPAIKPIALRMVWQCAQAVSIPIIGQGGITTWEDAAEFLLAGASALCVGTANFTNPMVPLEIIEGLKKWLEAEGCASVSEVVGAMRS